ncbi:MAG: cytochrome b5 domain-containing protein [Elusimicrobiota bacterium]
MKITAFLALCLFAAAAGPCRAEEAKPAAASVSTEAWKSRTFTAEELKKYNGLGGMPVYVAVDGIVYDLSRSKYWKTGEHMKMHAAGADLSSALHDQAPKMIHKDGKILEKMPKVGVLVKDAPATAGKPAAADKPAAVPADKPAPAVAGVTLHRITKEELGKEERCAVTRKTLKVTETTPAVEYKGKTYYFSSVPLVEKFTKEPEKYTGAMEKAKNLFKKKA